jgi:RNA polymerase sigma-70 factor (ECF subfamily)
MDLKEFKIQVLPLREKLKGYARRILSVSADADDAVQEVMMKLWDKRAELGECRSVEAFAMTLMHHTCIDMERLRKTNVPIDASEPSISTSMERWIEMRDEVQLVREIIASLPPLQRDIIRMKDVESYENEEIAEITGCNIEAIRSNLSRARKKVRDMYLTIIKEKKK